MLDFRQRLSSRLSPWASERVDQLRISDILHRRPSDISRAGGFTLQQIQDIRRAILLSALSPGDRWFDDQRESLESLLSAQPFPPMRPDCSVCQPADGAVSVSSQDHRNPSIPPASVESLEWLQRRRSRLSREQQLMLSWLCFKRLGSTVENRRTVPLNLRAYDYSVLPRHRLQPGDLDRLHAYRVCAAVASDYDCEVWFCAKQLGLALAAQKLGLKPLRAEAIVERVDRVMPYAQRVFVPSVVQVERGLWSMVLWRNALIAREGLLVGADDGQEGVSMTPEWLLRACMHHGAERLVLDEGVVSLAWAGLESIPASIPVFKPSAVRAWLGQVERLLIEGCEGFLDKGWRIEPAGLKPRPLPAFVSISPEWIDDLRAVNLAEALDERIASARELLEQYRRAALPAGFA